MALIFYNTGMQNLNEQNKSFPVDKCLTNVPVFCQICISLRGFEPALLSERLYGLWFLGSLFVVVIRNFLIPNTPRQIEIGDSNADTQSFRFSSNPIQALYSIKTKTFSCWLRNA